MKSFATVLLFAVLVVAGSLPTAAQVSSIDYVGYGWESGQAAVTDEFNFLGVASSVDAAFGVNPGTEELTIFVRDLINAGGTDFGGVIVTPYTGGYMEIYRDTAQDADWGVNPPNLTAPSTFSNGELFFAGEFTDMTMYVYPNGSGSFESHLNGIGGTMIDGSCTGCVYSWGGAFGPESEAQLIEGYTLQIDGVLEVDAAVSTDETHWDAVKALFRN